MRSGRAIFMGLGGAGLIGLLLFLIWPVRSPIDLRLANLEPSGMVDETGAECWLADLQIANHTAALIFLKPDNQKARALAAGQPTGNANLVRVVGNLQPDSTNVVVLLLPRRTELCRLELEYQLEAMSWRVWRRMGNGNRKRAMQWLPKSATTNLWPNVNSPDQKKWQRITLNVALPKSAAASAQSVGQ